MPQTVWKGRKIWHWKMSPPGQKVPNMLLVKRRGQLQIAPERMKWLGQSRDDTQLWMCLGANVKYDCLQNNITQEPGMLGQDINVNWMSLNRRWQKWTSTSQESMNYNGWEGGKLIQMTIISTTMGKNPLEESPRDSWESSPTPQFKSINSSALSFLYSPTLTSIH